MSDEVHEARSETPFTVPADGAVREELAKILGSPLFVQSALQRTFLTFSVEKTLSGNSGDLKEYVIRAEAFGPGIHFDPRIDFVVSRIGTGHE